MAGLAHYFTGSVKDGVNCESFSSWEDDEFFIGNFAARFFGRAAPPGGEYPEIVNDEDDEEDGEYGGEDAEENFDAHLLLSDTEETFPLILVPGGFVADRTA